MKSVIQFDEATHTYTVGGRVLPSVTQILPKVDFHISPEELEAARFDGQMNHENVRAYWAGGGKTFGLPYLEIYAKWYKENRKLVGDLVASETPLISRLGFAGTPDTIFSISIVDLKRTIGDKRIHALQMAGYFILMDENYGIRTKKWYVLAVDPPKYQFVNVYDERAEDIFRGLVNKHKIEKALNNYLNS